MNSVYLGDIQILSHSFTLPPYPELPFYNITALLQQLGVEGDPSKYVGSAAITHRHLVAAESSVTEASTKTVTLRDNLKLMDCPSSVLGSVLDQFAVPIVVKGRRKSGIVVVFEDDIVIAKESEKKEIWYCITHFPMGATLKVTNKIDSSKLTSRWVLAKPSKVKVFPLYFIQQRGKDIPEELVGSILASTSTEEGNITKLLESYNKKARIRASIVFGSLLKTTVEKTMTHLPSHMIQDLYTIQDRLAELKRLSPARPRADSANERNERRSSPLPKVISSKTASARSSSPRIPTKNSSRDNTVDTDSFVPDFIKLLCYTVEENASSQGIYRVSGLDDDIKQLKSAMDTLSLELENLDGFKIYTVADVLKVYLRELPCPLLGWDFYVKVITDLYQMADTEPQKWLEQLKALLQGLPIINYALMKYLARHLWHVSQKAEENLMSVSNLAIVFAPSILRPKEESAESAMCLPRIFPVVEAMVNEFQYLFDESPSHTRSVKPTLRPIEKAEVDVTNDAPLWVSGYDLLLVLLNPDLEGDKEKIASLRKSLSDPTLFNPFVGLPDKKTTPTLTLSSSSATIGMSSNNPHVPQLSLSKAKSGTLGRQRSKSRPSRALPLPSPGSTAVSPLFSPPSTGSSNGQASPTSTGSATTSPSATPMMSPAKKDRHKSFASMRTKTMTRKMATWKSKDIGKLSDKSSLEIAKATGLDKKYILDVDEALFKPSRLKTGLSEISEDDFISTFEDKLGPLFVLKNFFREYEKEKDCGMMDEKSFFDLLALLSGSVGTLEARARVVFKAYGGTNEELLFQGLEAILQQVKTVQGEDTPHARRLASKLDPYNESVVNFSSFLSRAEDLCITLFPPKVFEVDKARHIFTMFSEATEVRLSKDTQDLFNILRKPIAEESSMDKMRLMQLLDSPNLEINSLDNNGVTMLYYIVITNKDYFLDNLLESGANINFKYKSGKTVLHTAIEMGAEGFVSLLIAKGADVNLQDALGSTPLHGAVKANSLPLVKMLLEAGCKVSLVDKNKCSAFDVAAQRGHFVLFDELVKHGSDVNHISKQGYTPLHWAATSESTDFARKLIEQGGNVNARCELGTTPVHVAARHGRLPILELFYGSDPNSLAAVDDLGRTPLHLAAFRNDEALVIYLIKKCTLNLKLKDHKDRTALDIAKSLGNTKSASIIAAGPLQDQDESSKLLLGHFRKGDVAIVHELLKKEDANIHAANENGTTLMHYACMQGNAEILSLLLSRGANPNASNNRATTPIHKAAQRGEMECLELLVKANANVNYQDEEGITPLHRALNELGIMEGKKMDKKVQKIRECVQYLIKIAQIDLADHAGLYAFDVACRFGLQEETKLLIDAGALVDHVASNGWTPLHWAAVGGHTAIIETLISKGVDPKKFTKNKEGKEVDLPLHYAIFEGQYEAAKTLIRLGADPRTVTPQLKQTVLHLAANSGCLDTLKLFLEELNLRDLLLVKDSMGNTPLHLATTPETISYLLTFQEVDVTCENENGESPLMTAARWGFTDSIATWIEKGSDLHKKNNNGLTALYLSCLGRNKETMNILLSKGAKFIFEKSSSSLVFSHEPNNLFPAVKCGSLLSLIRHMTYDKYFDSSFAYNMLVGFRLHVTPIELFCELAKIGQKNLKDLPAQAAPTSYEVPPQPSSKQHTLESINLRKTKRIVPTGFPAVLDYWIKHFFCDFADSPELTLMYQKFMETHTKELGPLKKSFDILFSEQMEASSMNSAAYEEYSSFFTQKHDKHSRISAGNFIKMEPETIAKQFTYIDSLMFSQVDFRALISARAEEDSKSTSIVESMRHCTKMSNWAASTILSVETTDESVKLIKHFIEIGQKCLTQGNYNSVMWILDALSSPPVKRLKKTWREVGSIPFAKLFSPENEYKNYHEEIEETKKKMKVIPAFGVLLHDILSLDALPEYVSQEYSSTDEDSSGQLDDSSRERRLINFERIEKLGRIVKKFRKLQKIPNNSEVVVQRGFVEILLKSPISEKKLVKLSQKLEPRT
eukprot:TRINITY_DN7211_c0_g1_i1.p1 TRINITY_DN7211_c0_g1~~TRINITY_DN7211_c0_g1_i1.p1  ORF type:complete len:2010 (-),score=408.32 TRINITY_DN7211_c0_g1_i1:46-6075(-)